MIAFARGTSYTCSDFNPTMQRVKAHLKALGKALANSASILVCQISRASHLFLIKRGEYQLGKTLIDREFDDPATKQLVSRIRNKRQRLSANRAYAAPEGQNLWKRAVSEVKLRVERVWLKVSIIRQQLLLGRLVLSEPKNETLIPPAHKRRFNDLSQNITGVHAKEQALRHSTPWLLRQPILILLLSTATFLGWQSVDLVHELSAADATSSSVRNHTSTKDANDNASAHSSCSTDVATAQAALIKGLPEPATFASKEIGRGNYDWVFSVKYTPGTTTLLLEENLAYINPDPSKPKYSSSKWNRVRIPLSKLTALHESIHKYEEWSKTAKAEQLADDLLKELVILGDSKFLFRTPDTLVVQAGDEEMYLDSVDMESVRDNVHSVKAQLDEIKRKAEAKRKSDEDYAKWETEREQRRKADEKRIESLLK